MFGFNSSPASKHKLDKSAQEYIELQGKKKELEIETENLKLELANERKKAEMLLTEARHKFALERETLEARFKRSHDDFHADKAKFEDSLRREFDLKEKEVIGLLKLDSEQRSRQAELDRDRQIQELKMKHTEEISKLRSDLASEFYQKMQTELSKLNSEGNVNTRFVQEMSLKLLDKASATNTNTYEHRVISGNVRDLRELPRLEPEQQASN
jgi:methyl coenzyme M reductase subunit D